MDIYVDPERLLRYSYKTENRSIVDTYILRHWWPVAIKAIPARAPANLVSMIGNLGSYFAFLILCGAIFGPVSVAGIDKPWIFGLIAFAYFFYQTLDALDGIQARRVGSSGPLGEFVDHWFDSFNVFMVPLGLALAFPVVPYQLAAAALLVFAAVDWFQLRAVASLEVLVFPPISSEEAQVLNQLFFVLIWIFGYSLFSKPLVLGVPFITIGYLALIIGMLLSAASCVKDSRALQLYLPELLSLAPIFIWILLMYPRIGGTALLVGGLLLGFSGSRFSGELLRERLIGSRYRPFMLDILVLDAIILAVAASKLPDWAPLAAALAALAWTVLALARQFAKTVARVRLVTGRGLFWPLTD